VSVSNIVRRLKILPDCFYTLALHYQRMSNKSKLFIAYYVFINGRMYLFRIRGLQRDSLEIVFFCFTISTFILVYFINHNGHDRQQVDHSE